MIVLPDGENRMIVASFVSTKHRNVTERQTAGRSDRSIYSGQHSKLCRRAVKIRRRHHSHKSWPVLCRVELYHRWRRDGLRKIHFVGRSRLPVAPSVDIVSSTLLVKCLRLSLTATLEEPFWDKKLNLATCLSPTSDLDPLPGCTNGKLSCL